jgi:hypothetical protein
MQEAVAEEVVLLSVVVEDIVNNIRWVEIKEEE